MKVDVLIVYAFGFVLALAGVALLTKSPATVMIVMGLLAISFARWADGRDLQ